MSENLVSAKFKSAVRSVLFKKNGHFCPSCSRRIIRKSGHFIRDRKTDLVIATIHHITFKSSGGLGTEKNGFVCCRDCHEELHRFLAFFVIDSKDYDLYTCFYYWLFRPVGEEKSVRARKRFHFKKYCSSLNDFKKMFLDKVAGEQPILCRVLLVCYIFQAKGYLKIPVKSEFVRRFTSSYKSSLLRTLFNDAEGDSLQIVKSVKSHACDIYYKNAA